MAIPAGEGGDGDGAHARGLRAPIIEAVLEDAEGVDPEVTLCEAAGDLDRVAEGGGEGREREAGEEG